MYRCKHFGIKELVSSETYKDRGEAAWELLDPEALKVLDHLREEFGPTTCNDWSWGGRFQNRGFRDSNTTVGATYSQHKMGRGFDVHFKNITVDAAREKLLDLIKKKDKRFLAIKGIGINSGFLHFDTRNREDLITFTYS